ncbi:hypothetical protein FBU31_003395 [Coemansia sp. 'formosensis']|nr:hypothetical protein FBU31_003395 [Coemansia sp. 'formosensis']
MPPRCNLALQEEHDIRDVDTDTDTDAKSTTERPNPMDGLKWEIAVKAIPTFDGSNPLQTQEWLDLIEECFPVTDEGCDIRTVSARVRLTGQAESRMAKLLRMDWNAFCKRLLGIYNPETAYSALVASIESGKRYVGLADIMEAITLAMDDHRMILDYHKADKTDLAPTILGRLLELFPEGCLAAAQANKFGDFNAQIVSLTTQVTQAIGRQDNASKWASATTTQAYIATPGPRRKTRHRQAAPAAAPLNNSNPPSNSGSHF